MATFDWRSWVFSTLSGHAPLLALVSADSIYGAGSLTKPPTKQPFIVIKMEPEVPGPFEGVTRSRVALWAHDEPGDYLRLGTVLAACRVALCGSGANVGQVAQPGAVAARWQGDSGDLADPDFGTILRTATFDLLGKG